MSEGARKALPTLEEFFTAHGVLTHAPRRVLPFHRRIFDAVTRWVSGTLPNGARHLAICIPPRHSKTMTARDTVSWAQVAFPDAEWIFTACTATLAISQTLAIRATMASDWYAQAFPHVGVGPRTGRQDYFTTPLGGAVYGVGVGGTITGFGAGKKRPEFGGGIIIDDPLQAADAYSAAERESCNRWYSQVLYSRRNAAHTPVMLIMQRLHEHDLVGHVTEVEGDLWHVLDIPVVDDAGAMLWPETFSTDSARRMAEIDPFAYSAQYLQSPTPMGGAMIKTDWIQRYEVAPPMIAIGIFADTAQKTGQHNDWSVFLAAGTDGQNVYALDMVRERLEAPDLLDTALSFWQKHKPRRASNPARFAGFFVEDKASGTGLIQSLRRDKGIPVISVPRTTDKVSRVNDILPHIRSGRLWVPQHAAWAAGYIGELASFSPALTHRHDDQVDVTVDAINELLSSSGGIIVGGDWS